MEDYDSMIREAFRRRKENGVSVTDLILCLRKKVFSILNPAMTTMGDDEFFKYIAGDITQKVVAEFFAFYSERFITELEVQYKNIKGRIDIYDKIDNVVIEIKLSRSKLDIKPSKIHEDQIKSYMAIKGVSKGLLYYYSSNFERLSKHEVTMNSQEREEWLEELNLRNEALEWSSSTRSFTVSSYSV